MKHTLNAILHLPSAISADLKARDEKRRRARIYRNMQDLTVKQAKPQTFGFKVGEVIETGNHPVVRLPVVKVGAQ